MVEWGMWEVIQEEKEGTLTSADSLRSVGYSYQALQDSLRNGRRLLVQQNTQLKAS